MKTKIVIIGATSTIAELCARKWIAQRNVEMVLVGRDAQRLAMIAQDLGVRAPENRVDTAVVDFTDPEAIQQLAADICATGVPQVVLIAQGSLPVQLQCQGDIAACRDALEINGISPVLFAEAFAAHMDKADAGTIAIIGSVAGDRGRQSNYVYGAAKGLVERYVQGLQHRFYGRNINALVIKPGPTDTRMTAALKSAGARLADPADVATLIVDGIAAAKPVIYAPKKWMPIMMVIRLLPNFIFGRCRI